MARKQGKTYWFDLPVKDLTDAMSFYEGLFGWKFVRLQGDEKRDYLMIQVDNELIGGLREVNSNGSKKGEFTGPLIYFTVDELQPKIDRAKELGAKLVGERVDLGQDRGSYQWFKDRAENLVALWAPK